MEPPAGTDLSRLDARLTALEVAVARLSSLLEPSFMANRIAAPVAIPSAKEASLHEFSAKFFALMDMGEALLKYSAAIAFAYALKAGGDEANEVRDLFSIPPTLGKIADGLRRIVDTTRTPQWPLDVLRQSFRKQNDRPTSTARYLFDEFIRIRNDVRGHGAQQPEGYYEDLYTRNHLVVQDCIRACPHLEIPLVHLHSVDLRGELFAYAATLLVGTAPVRLSQPILTRDKARSKSTCLWDRDQRLLDLRGFVAYRYCPTCKLEHVFFADRITPQRISYHSYVGNHRCEVEQSDAVEG